MLIVVRYRQDGVAGAAQGLQVPGFNGVYQDPAHRRHVPGSNLGEETHSFRIDFSTYRSGDPVIATASGQVVTVGYDASYGNYIIIKHKHGIYTRYAHLMSSRVTKGQFISQRDVIGYVGNTGVTTGPHLHYEVHIGSDVVDPAKYINVKLSN